MVADKPKTTCSDRQQNDKMNGRKTILARVQTKIRNADVCYHSSETTERRPNEGSNNG